MRRIQENADLAAKVEIAAVAARQLDRAQAFADEHGIAKAYGSCKCSRSLCVFFQLKAAAAQTRS